MTERKPVTLLSGLKNLWRNSNSQDLDDQPSESTRTSMEVQPARAPSKFLTDDEMKPTEIEGRQFIVESTYMLATDEKEARRLDAQHFVFKDLLGGNITAPIKPKNLASILDVGCGSGIWPIEVAKEFPESHVYAFDIRMMDVPRHLVPSNVLFQRADVTSGLPYMSRSFDYIHQRLVVGGIKVKDWPVMLEEYHRVLRPGGWVELIEGTFQMYRQGPVLGRILEIFREQHKLRGMDLMEVDNLPTHMKKVGFTKINLDKTRIMGWGTWAGPIAAVYAPLVHAVYQTVFILCVKDGLTTKEESEELLAKWQQECNEYQSYMHVYVYTAQRRP